MKKICVLGLGYIGLPTSVVFANAGYEVVGVDLNKEAVELINQGRVHIEENGLPELVQEMVTAGRFSAALEPTEAVVFIIAVPTPINENNQANLDYVISAIYSILPYLRKGSIVIVESTIPPRTIDDVVATILQEAGWNLEAEIHLAHCPERVLPGRILIEMVENTRIVGGYTPEAAEKAADVYRQVVTGDVIETKATTAEMAKLMENTYRDVNIALANELAMVSTDLGINALEVIELANHHPRVNLHLPGPGVGGHCLAVDPYFIIEKSPELSPLIALSRDINTSMPQFVVDQIMKSFDKNAKITVFGLTYKGNIDDIRESPAMEIVKLLNYNDFNLAIYDPHVKQEQTNLHLSTFDEAIEGSECILVLTDHNEFKELNEGKLLQKMKRPFILDTKNCISVHSEQIEYYNFNNMFGIVEAKTPVHSVGN